MLLATQCLRRLRTETLSPAPTDCLGPSASQLWVPRRQCAQAPVAASTQVGQRLLPWHRRWRWRRRVRLRRCWLQRQRQRQRQRQLRPQPQLQLPSGGGPRAPGTTWATPPPPCAWPVMAAFRSASRWTRTQTPGTAATTRCCMGVKGTPGGTASQRRMGGLPLKPQIGTKIRQQKVRIRPTHTSLQAPNARSSSTISMRFLWSPVPVKRNPASCSRFTYSGFTSYRWRWRSVTAVDQKDRAPSEAGGNASHR